MTKSKLSLRNSAKPALLFSLFGLLILALSACSSSTSPSYLREDITRAIENTSRKEYEIEVKARLYGATLWVYIPVEDMFLPLDEQDKPAKYTEKFAIENNSGSLENSVFKFDYHIRNTPEEEKTQEVKTNEKVFKKIQGVLIVLRRVLFSSERAKYSEPDFFCIVAADIKNGFQLRQLSYYPDLKKVSYGLIGIEEYQHRMVQDITLAPQAVGDAQGDYIEYKDIYLGDFLLEQIRQRIKMKFSKPEVAQNADIDKEIMKVITSVIKNYDFRDFSAAEITNMLTGDRIVLNRAAILDKATER